jgi:hypothetical protein
MAIPLPARLLMPRRNEHRDVVRPILAALNRMRGVRVVRNLSLGAVVPYARRLEPSPPRFVAGLGLGSADLVGIVQCATELGPKHFGRVFCLECKLSGDGGRRGVTRADQKRWLAAVRKLGGFACVVRSVDDAERAVERCRAGESE